jgi:glycosyltransferase involved in cell wall biosynthesis
MSAIKAVTEVDRKLPPLLAGCPGEELQNLKPLVSLVVPAYNEAPIVEKNLSALCQYMESVEDNYRWELIVVNDGSTDETGKLAEAFAKTRDNIQVLHHPRNFGLGRALRSAFPSCSGDYIVTVDLDLSYAPAYVEQLVEKMRESKAKVVAASPYMKGGKISNVPSLRRILSVWANRFLSIAAKGNLSTLTGMVRAYDRKFLSTLSWRSMGMEINPEIIYKTMLLSGAIEEIPAHLDWKFQKAEGIKRKSSMKIMRQMFSILLSGFLFRPVTFFLFPGFVLLLFALYADAWVLIHFFEHYSNLPQYSRFDIRASAAVIAAFNAAPHTFIVGGLASILSIQLISLGILALQSRNYFEEIFHLGTSLYAATQEKRSEKNE